MATYGKDFFGRWVVLVGNKCIGAFHTKDEARQKATEWNEKNA